MDRAVEDELWELDRINGKRKVPWWWRFYIWWHTPRSAWKVG